MDDKVKKLFESCWEDVKGFSSDCSPSDLLWLCLNSLELKRSLKSMDNPYDLILFGN